MMVKMYPELKKYKDIGNMKDLAVANFGTGLGYYDFCYEGLGINAFNFSLTQQTLEFDYKLLKHYASKLRRDCKICLVLPYTILCAHNIKEIVDRNERYYSILPKADVEGSCNTSYEEYIKKVQSLSDITGTLYIKKALTQNEMLQQSVEAIGNWERELGILSFNAGDMSSKVENAIKCEKEWLKRIIQFCHKHILELILIVPPMSCTLLDKISLEFRESHFYKPIYETIGNQNIQVIDYVKENKFCDPNLYGWPGFLIEKAAKDFTKNVLKRIEVIH